MNNHYDIEYKDNNTILYLLNKYSSILNKKVDELYFIYKGNNLALNYSKKINDLKNAKIFVFNMNIKNEHDSEEVKHLICPECKNLSIFKNNDDLFSFNCINNHKFDGLSISSLIDSQIHDNQYIKCNICGNNKKYYNKFYKCSNGNNICSICSENCKNNFIDYEYRFYICIKHNMKYISYCKECNINLCQKCEEEHKTHKNKIKIFKDIQPSKKRIKEIKNEETKINSCKNELKNMGQYMNNVINIIIDNLDKYNILYKYIINSIDYISNFESINNILNFDSKKLIKNINYLINENNINNKISQILNIYNNMKNEITIIYKNNQHGKFRLFSENFVKNNKENCYLLINNKKFSLCEFFPIDCKEDNIKIKLIENKKITNMSYMFDGSGSLSSLPDIWKWNTNNVTNMRYMFFDCRSLSSLSDISNWNTTNVIDMNHMFAICLSLSSLPDISNWNTTNVIDMGACFFSCYRLLSLPDISNWNTKNVKYMNSMFSGCQSLMSLPDISKWNTTNIINMDCIFYECKQNLNIPEKFKNCL